MFKTAAYGFHSFYTLKKCINEEVMQCLGKLSQVPAFWKKKLASNQHDHICVLLKNNAESCITLAIPQYRGKLNNLHGILYFSFLFFFFFENMK